MPFALIALTIASFGIGTTEFVIMGLLPDVANDLGVTIPVAGMLVSGYALSVAIGAPIVAVATIRLPRKGTLLGLMGIFIAGNLLCAVAPNYSVLMAARIGTALCHGAFFGIGAVVAANLVPQKQRARAIALMFAGLTLANVLGVPLGTALGQSMGWRATFWAVTGIGCIAALAIVLWVPANIPAPQSNLLREVRVLGKTQVLLAMAISILGSASLFSVFTYITPILEDVSGLSPHGVTGALLLFGVGLTIGNIAGGYLADWKLMPSLIGILIALIGVLTLFSFTDHRFVPALLTVPVWGALAFALVPLLQTRVVDKASDAPSLASTLIQGTFNLGNAFGAWLGGDVILHGASYAALPWLGALIALLALGLSGTSFWLERGSESTRRMTWRLG